MLKQHTQILSHPAYKWKEIHMNRMKNEKKKENVFFFRSDGYITVFRLFWIKDVIWCEDGINKQYTTATAEYIISYSTTKKQHLMKSISIQLALQFALAFLVITQGILQHTIPI